jgi:hypothetical protein
VKARASILIEVMVATAIFVAGALAVIASLSRGQSALTLLREQERSMDLARSAMSAIEAGIATPTTLDGPVAGWEEQGGPFIATEPGNSSSQASRVDGGWELRILTEPAPVEGLMLVSLTAQRRGAAGEIQSGSVVTLRQYVPVRAEAKDRAGVPR